MTFVEGPRVRPFRPDLFADITDAVPRIEGSGLEFDGELSAEDVAAIRDRLTSKSDVHQAQRAVLRGDRDALDEDSPLRRLYDAVLGD